MHRLERPHALRQQLLKLLLGAQVRLGTRLGLLGAQRLHDTRVRLLDARLELVDLRGEFAVHFAHGKHAAVRLAHGARRTMRHELDEVAFGDQHPLVALQVALEHCTVCRRQARVAMCVAQCRKLRVQLGARQHTVEHPVRALCRRVAEQLGSLLRE